MYYIKRQEGTCARCQSVLFAKGETIDDWTFCSPSCKRALEPVVKPCSECRKTTVLVVACKRLCGYRLCNHCEFNGYHVCRETYDKDVCVLCRSEVVHRECVLPCSQEEIQQYIDDILSRKAYRSWTYAGLTIPWFIEKIPAVDGVNSVYRNGMITSVATRARFKEEDYQTKYGRLYTEDKGHQEQQEHQEHQEQDHQAHRNGFLQKCWSAVYGGVGQSTATRWYCPDWARSLSSMDEVEREHIKRKTIETRDCKIRRMRIYSKHGQSFIDYLYYSDVDLYGMKGNCEECQEYDIHTYMH
jgi:hypothetical protein